MIKQFIKDVLIVFRPLIKPFIRALAEMCDLPLNYHCVAQGQNPLIIEDFEYAKNHNITKSAYFNTGSGTIRIGKNTLISENVMFLTGKHYNIQEATENSMPLHHVPDQGRDIRVGRGCFIGAGAIIIGKVEIGDYAVIGAGSVVTRDVPPRAFVAGVPAHVIRML